MTVRHITSVDNVDDEGYLIDPSACGHGTISSGTIDALAGLVDPLTHLNRDFPEHQLDECVVAEQLAIGSSLVREPAGEFRRAVPRRAAMEARGRVDQGARRVEWLTTLRARREGTHNAGR
jgi:hypothetical protein